LIWDFAWFVLPNGITVSLIVVPGHRDFIEKHARGRQWDGWR
jgi:hypothetical protein